MTDETWTANTHAKSLATLTTATELRVVDDPSGIPTSKKTNLGAVAAALQIVPTANKYASGASDHGALSAGYYDTSWLLAGGGNANAPEYCLFAGVHAGQLKTAGGDCVYIGPGAGANDVMGWDATAVGSEALRDWTGLGTYGSAYGVGNSAYGKRAMSDGTHLVGNSAFGDSALERAEYLYQCTASGYGAFAMLGTNALHSTDAAAWQSADYSACGYNTAYGYGSGLALTYGSGNTFIGHSAGSSGSQIDGVVNSTAIGYGSYTTASNQIALGNASTTETLLLAGKLTLPGALSFTGGGTLVAGGAENRIKLGADSDSPVAHTLGISCVNYGVSNTAGADFNFFGSRGTGTGAGGNHVFYVAPAGASGSNQNALVEAFRIRSDKVCVTGSHLYIASGFNIGVYGRGQITADSAGVFRLLDWNGTSCVGIKFGLATNAFPYLKLSGANLQVRLADDSAFSGIQGKLTTETAYTATPQTCSGYLTMYDSSGTPYKVLVAA